MFTLIISVIVALIAYFIGEAMGYKAAANDYSQVVSFEATVMKMPSADATIEKPAVKIPVVSAKEVAAPKAKRATSTKVAKKSKK